MSGPFGSSQWMYNAGGGFYDHSIDGSLRFNDDDSAYLNRTPSSAGNRRTWTWSAWVKRSSLGANSWLFSAGDNANNFDQNINFNPSNQLVFWNRGGGNLTTTQLFRDVSAWYHIVAVWNTTDSTASDRMRLYVNGSEITSFSTDSNPSLNLEGSVNSTSYVHSIGRRLADGLYFDGYLSDVHFIDGTALDPTSFGETKDGVWIPKSYSGSYGTNGFHLKFDDVNPTAGYGLSNVTYDSKSFSVSSYTNNGVFSLALNPSGTELFLSGKAVSGAATTNYINKFPLSTAFDISTASTSNVTEYQLTETSSPVYGPYFLNSGSKLYTFANARIQEYSLSTPYDISTRSYEGDFQLVTSTGSVITGNDAGFALSPDGTKFFKLSNSGPAFPYTKPVYAYSMSTAFDVSTASYLTEISSTVSDIPSNNMSGLAFNSSGTEMYILAVSSTYKGVWVYNLSTGFDLSTASFGSNLTGDFYLTEDSYPKEMSFSPDGKKLLLFGSTNDEVFQYSTERSTIGDDTSGNENDWTPNNFISTDVVPDSPTNNFATLNVLTKGTSNTSLAEGNLKASGVASGSGSNWGTVFSSHLLPTTGKYYVEALAFIVTGSGNSGHLGVLDTSSFRPSNSNITYAYTTGEGFDGVYISLFNNYAQPVSDGVLGTAVGSLTGTTVVAMLAVDVDNGKVWAGYNGTWINSGNPAAGTGEIATRTFSSNDAIAVGTAYNGSNDQGMFANFGQDSTFAGTTTAGGNADDNGLGDFKYAVPSGFLALCSANLPEPVVGPLGDSLSGDNFNAVLWTGNSTNNTVITGVGFQPDWVWIKQRSGGEWHRVHDTVRGVSQQLYSNATNAEATTTNNLLSVNSDGFTLGTDSAVNYSGSTYVGWNWEAGGTAVANTDGSITSQVSANVDAGFSIVSYVGTGSAATVGHGLSSIPEFIIVKNRSNTGGWSWVVYDKINGANKYMYLNGTAASATYNMWNNTSPTSSVFSVSGYTGTNGSSDAMIAYCFADVEGYSKVGRYTGNGSTNGTFVYTGFRPAWILIRLYDNGGTNWLIYDNKRDPYNVTDEALLPNSSSATGGSANALDMLSNGFKFRSAAGSLNGNNYNYIYLAFAENPFKYANAG